MSRSRPCKILPNFFETSSISEIDDFMQEILEDQKLNKSVSLFLVRKLESIYADACVFFTVDTYLKDPILVADKFYHFFKHLQFIYDLPIWNDFAKMYIPLLNISNGRDEKLMHALLTMDYINHSEIMPHIISLATFQNYVSTYCNHVSSYIVTLFDANTFKLPAEYRLWLAEYAFDSLYTASLYQEITDDYPLYTRILKHSLACSSDLLSDTVFSDLKFKILALYTLLNDDPGWHEFFSEDVNDDYGFINNSMLVLTKELLGEAYHTNINIAKSLGVVDDYEYWKSTCLKISPVQIMDMPVFD